MNATQGMLLSDVAHARRTDPKTSHLAAAKVNVSHHKRLILAVLVRGPATSEEIVARILDYWPDENPSDSSIRSRCKQLERDGYVRVKDQEGRTSRGNRAQRWELVP